MPETPLVVVVDDEAPIRDSVDMFLSGLGYRVRTFASAEALLEDLPAGQSVCLLLDVRVPGMNGFELVDELVRRGINWPIALMTGHGEEAAKAFAASSPATIEVFAKPVSSDAVANFAGRSLAVGR
jgi:two-component system response regulator FixJ